MIIERLEATLARDEGKNLSRHDVDGIPHIGIGRNLEGRGLTDKEMSILGITDEDELQEINEKECSMLFENDVDLALEIVHNIMGDAFDELTDVRQEVLLNMAFNMGEPRLRRFKNMWLAIDEQDWEEASDEMLDSRAARQTGKRYYRLSSAMENDDGNAFEVEYALREPEEEPEQKLLVDAQYVDNDQTSKIMERLDILDSDIKNIHGKVDNILAKLTEKFNKTKAPRSKGTGMF